jgi:hypothetical protein
MQHFMKDMTKEEVQYLIKDCDLEIKALKSKLVSIMMERDHILRKIRLVKREKGILEEVEKEIDINIDQTHIVHPGPTVFAKFLETNENDPQSELDKSLYLRYTNSLKRYGERENDE